MPNSAIHTGLYRLDIRDNNSDIAHIYEHLLIRSFEKLLADKGFNLCLYGWINGETFREVSFIEYGFYSEKVEHLFKEFLRADKKADVSLLDPELARIEAETKTIIAIPDREALLDELARLDKAEWEDVETSTRSITQFLEVTPQIKPELIEIRDAPNSFQDVTIALGIASEDLADKVLFLRALPIIYDALVHYTYETGMYQVANSPVIYDEAYDALTACAIFSIRNDTAVLSDIETTVVEYLKRLNLNDDNQELTSYITGYLSTPGWSAFPIDYYRDAGIVVSKKQIAELITPDNLRKLLNNLTLKVVETAPDHYDLCS